MVDRPNDDTFYRSYRLHCWPGCLSVWCSVYRDGVRLADFEADYRDEAIGKAMAAIDEGEVRR